METLNVEFLKRPKGTIGFWVRCSRTKKTASMAAARPSSPSTSGEVQEWSRVMDSAIINGIRPAISATAPGKSISRIDALERTNGMVAATSRTATMPTGRLT